MVRPMQPSALLDKLFGRDRLEIEDGAVSCPLRDGALDVDVCSSCPYWFRTELDASGHGVVVCRSRTLSGGDATLLPPM